MGQSRRKADPEAVANDSGTEQMLAAADLAPLSLFGPTAPEKFAPHISRGAVIKARAFDRSGAMEQIPPEPVFAGIEALIRPTPPSQ